MSAVSQRELMETALSFSLVLVAGALVMTAIYPGLQLFGSPLQFLLAALALASALYWVWRTAPVEVTEPHQTGAALADFTPSEYNDKAMVPTRPPLSDTARASIAVLPLQNLSENDEDAFLAQGFSAEIIRALYGIPDLRVASYQQSVSYSDRDLQDITHDLDVRYVLTGSMQRRGDRVRIIVMLTDAHERTQLWSESYSKDLSDIFNVQSEIADTVAAQVGSEFLNVVTSDISRELPQNLSAWGLVHRAMNFWITSYTKAASEETLTLLEQAVRQQPDYAMAHAELGFIHSQRVMNAFTTDVVDGARIALECANRAYALAPRDATVMERTGLVWFNCGLSNRSARLLREVVKAAPHDLVAWGYLANAMGMGGNETGIREAQGILARLLANAPRHPSVPFWNYFSANTYAQAGDWRQAEEFASVAVGIHPGFCIGWFALGNARGNLGDNEGARAAELAARESNPDFTFQMFYEYMLGHSSQWENKDMQFKGLLAAGLVEEQPA